MAYLAPPLREFRLQLCHDDGAKKSRTMSLPEGEKSDDRFPSISRSDVLHLLLYNNIIIIIYRYISIFYYIGKYNRFDKIPVFNRQTDGRTDGQQWYNNIARCTF